jgi:hypothetical protein
MHCDRSLHNPLAVIGCDVGKSKIAVYDSRDGRTRFIHNAPEDLPTLAARLDPDCLVICEATGGYELTLLAAMVLAGIPAHRADARKVKRSSARSPRWPRPTASMPAPWPTTARSATPVWPAGRRGGHLDKMMDALEIEIAAIEKKSRP